MERLSTGEIKTIIQQEFDLQTAPQKYCDYIELVQEKIAQAYLEGFYEGVEFANSITL